MKRLRELLFIVVVLIPTSWLVGKWLLRMWRAEPPPLPADVSIMQAKPEVRHGKTWLGQSWVTQREGLRVIRLKGSAFEMGFAAGKLLEEQMHTLEDEFLVMIRSYVPQAWKMTVLRSYIAFRNRRLSDYVALDYRQQIYGTTLGCTDNHPEMGDYYDRLLNYHAAHDISYMMIDNPLVSKAGCTSFGAWGSATENGHLITGRNFDWEAAEAFSRDRVVMLCEPDGDIPYVSLAWGSMAGVVSGMNRAGISVTLNGAPSNLPADTATPTAMLARHVLQKAHNLTEALDIIRSNRVFVSTLWLVGSKMDGKFIVVEKTPGATNVREPEGNSIVSANHFQTDKLRDARRNQHYIAEATSLSRYQRMGELIQTNRGSINPARAAEMLRDRQLPGGKFVGNGHRSAINALIATHGTIMDLTDGLFWAASPPNQLGKFVAFDVNDFDRELPALTVPADAMLRSGEFARARSAHQSLGEAARALQQGDAAAAVAATERAEANNPGFYQNAWLRGRALLGAKRSAEAITAFETALAAQPAFQSEKQEIETWLQQAKIKQ